MRSVTGDLLECLEKMTSSYANVDTTTSKESILKQVEVV